MVTDHIAVKSCHLKNSSQIRRLLQSPTILSLILMMIRASSLVIKFLLTLYIARFLGLEALGFFGLITAASIVFPNLVGLGIAYTVCRRAVTSTQEELVVDIKYFLRFFCLVYSLILAASIAYGIDQDQLFFSVTILLIICMEHLNGTSYQLQQNLSEPISANILHFIRTSLWALIFMALSYFYEPARSIEFLLTLWVIGSFVALICFVWLVREWPWRTQLPQETLVSWIIKEYKISNKAYYSGVFDTISMYQDRYLIGFFLGLELTGVFVFFWQITSAMGNLLWTGIVQVTRPKLVKAHKNLDHAYDKMYKRCLVQALIGAVFASVMSIIGLKLLLPYLHRPLVEDMFGVYYLMVLAFVLSVVRETQKLLYYSQHRDDLILKINILTFIISIITTVTFVLTGGLWGASLSMLLVNLCAVLAQIYHKKRLLIFPVGNEKV